MNKSIITPLIPPHGGYRKLKSFQVAQLAYDLTVLFTERYVPRNSRTRDQMVQAARSGVQNIAEGSQASATSKKTELKLTNVARASLEELKLDYEDFLRQHGLRLWGKDDPRPQRLIAARCENLAALRAWINGPCGRFGQLGQESPNSPSSRAEIAANAALTLIGVACTLLDRQIERLARDFVDEGGFTERLYRVRTEARSSILHNRSCAYFGKAKGFYTFRPKDQRDCKVCGGREQIYNHPSDL